MSEHDDHRDTGSIGDAEAAGVDATTGDAAAERTTGDAAEGATANADEGGHPQPRYMAVWGGLAVLTLLEVGVAFMGFSRSVTVVALLGMAAWKALLVALYYMHLRFEPNAVRIVAAAPLVPAAILMLLVIFEW